MSAEAFSRLSIAGASLRRLKRDVGPEMLIAAIAVPEAFRIGAATQVASVMFLHGRRHIHVRGHA